MTAPNTYRCIFTIGHSTHALHHFLGLLKQHEIQRIVDVRSTPYSRWQPQYNREGLNTALKLNGLDYEFMGAELGARSDDRSCYDNRKVVYNRLAAASGFRAAINKLGIESSNLRIALMCAEQEPLDCHRTILVSRELEAGGVGVFHIHSDGRLESQADSMLRLLRILKMPEMDLFHTTEEIIENAYMVQEDRIAYVDHDLESQEHAPGAFR